MSLTGRRAGPVVSWRYHVVSLVAVFLALAVGVAAGGLVLHGTVVGDLHRQVRQARSDQDQTAARLDQSQAQNARAGALIAALTPRLLSGKLTGNTVLLITCPGSDDATRQALLTRLGTAGAGIAGDLQFTDTINQVGSAPLIADLAARLVPAGLQVTGVGRHPLLSIIAATTSGPSPVGDRNQILAALTGAGLVTATSHLDAAATSVIIVGAGGVLRGAAASLVADLATAWTSRKVAVVAGAAGAANSSLTAVRRDPTLTRLVSTVDQSDLEVGPLELLTALIAERNGIVGHYGGAGQSAAVPPI